MGGDGGTSMEGDGGTSRLAPAAGTDTRLFELAPVRFDNLRIGIGAEILRRGVDCCPCEVDAACLVLAAAGCTPPLRVEGVLALDVEGVSVA